MTMRKYRSHKTVDAFKISAIVLENGIGATLYGGGGVNVQVAPSYMGKHEPKVGGYYVSYADGYESWSPGDTFEAGYSLVGQ